MTNGASVKPAIPFEGKDFQDRAAAEAPRSTCADVVPPNPQVKGVAGSPLGLILTRRSVRRLCVCDPPLPPLGV